MDVLDLRNLAFDCAENMPCPAGEESMVREYSYLNGRGFTSATNSRWGHGILSLTCLFTPERRACRIRPPVMQSPAGSTGPWPDRSPALRSRAWITPAGTSGMGLRYPVARENWALAATANLERRTEAFSGYSHLWAYGSRGVSAARCGPQRRDYGSNLTAAAPGGGAALGAAAGNAIGNPAGWQRGGFMLQSGHGGATRRGQGSLTGLRAFRAPVVGVREP